jgi:molecular chaperone DnaK
MTIGIDLGSQQLSAAWVGPNGSPQLVPDKHDAEVFHTPASLGLEGGRTFVGRAADVLAEDNPAAPVARSLKLSLGSPEPVLHDMRRRPWLAETALTVVLQKILDDATLASGSRPKFAVLTVPQDFTSAQRQAVLRAADWTGLQGALLLDRSLAAARYLAAAPDRPASLLALVLVVGTRFAEATLLDVGERSFKVRATACARTGGSQMDEALLRALQPGLGGIADDPANLPSLTAAIAGFRRRLAKSGAKEAEAVLFVRGRPCQVHLLSSHYEQVIAPVVAQLIGLAERVLQQAGVNWNQVDVCWPVAGCAQEPAVLQALAAKCGRPVQPRQAIQAAAFGAALHAADLVAGSAWGGLARLPGSRGAALALRLVDSEKRVKLDELIPAGSPWPAQAVKRFATSRADQARMVFDLVFADAANIDSAALVAFGPIPKPRLNLGIDLHVSVNAHGLLIAEATDTSTGNKLPRTLLTRGASSEPLVTQRTFLEGLRHV